MENQTQTDDWRKDIGTILNPKLKIADGETKTILFLDEGKLYKHPDYKPCVIFTVQLVGQEEKYTWFVNKEAYGTLNQVILLGKLTGLRATIKRTGSKLSDTRYEIKKI